MEGGNLVEIVTCRSVTEYLIFTEGSASHTLLLQILEVTFIHIMGLIIRKQISYHDTGGCYYKYLLRFLVFSVLHCEVDVTNNSF